MRQHQKMAACKKAAFVNTMARCGLRPSPASPTCRPQRIPTWPHALHHEEHAGILAAQDELARAEADYRRARAAYLQVARDEPGHEVALAMIGADMDRAYAGLQAITGLPHLPYAPRRPTGAPREASGPAQKNS